MSYKSIMVHLDTSTRAQTRLELALKLARQSGAHLSGLFATFSPDPRSFLVMAGSAEYYAQHEKIREQERGGLERLFRAELARARIEGDWVEAQGDVNEVVPRAARCADLLIVGQDDPNDPESFVADQFCENVVLSSGRPVLFVPYAGTFTTLGERIMVAWDGSREAARAVQDAMPLLKAAKHVVVVTVNELHHQPAGGRIPGADVATLIARHGASVETLDIEGVKDMPIGEMLLSRITDVAADLVVMGAYGHTRWRELMLGGATRTLLRSMTVPVLMSH